ncbi:MAG: acyl-CoA thioesterase [Verrucomicrobiales bacterium]|nr:acyl-CoA thioesterase [Verrucomicrobiales bacterium]
METLQLVRPEHLNHYGFLFGGYMLMWVDEAAWIAASLERPDCHFVTIGMEKVEFRHKVQEGSILMLSVQQSRVGKTSVTYQVDVTCRHDAGHEKSAESVFSNQVTMVRVDEAGEKMQL